jgi:phage/conjugal plasmid C-4 type zinc finger TraR family protein
MADIADRASDLEQADRDRAIARQERIIQSMRGNSQGRADCADCGDPIEPERRIALPFTGRCASCAHDAEQRLRMTGCKV